MRVTNYSETELKNSECLGAAEFDAPSGGGPTTQSLEQQPSVCARSILMTVQFYKLRNVICGLESSGKLLQAYMGKISYQFVNWFGNCLGKGTKSLHTHMRAGTHTHSLLMYARTHARRSPLIYVLFLCRKAETRFKILNA